MPYNYSATSQERLDSCHVDIQVIWAELKNWVNASVFCGHRGKEAQNKAYMENKSKLKFPDSKHNLSPSMAVDSGPFFIEIHNTDWNDKLAFARFAGRVDQITDQLLKEGKITHSIIWGGDWDGDNRSTDQRFMDLPHFQLKAVS
jgi:peptidoglycan L-alanyl-D-glutamate endopeptidase CwlK